MIKDLGPDILNLVQDPENYDPWVDEDRPSHPSLDDKLAATKAARDYLINSEVLLPVGDSHKVTWVLHQKHDHERQLVALQTTSMP